MRPATVGHPRLTVTCDAPGCFRAISLALDERSYDDAESVARGDGWSLTIKNRQHVDLCPEHAP